MEIPTIIRAAKRFTFDKLLQIQKTTRLPSRSSERVFLPRLSVIVPCYNVEKYLLETLKSIKGQDYHDLEVIIVNDGSTDNTGNLAEEFCSSNPKFKVIHKDNQGLGAARNTGISLATGEYITFIDSDDTIPKKSLTLMVATLRKTGSDFAVGTMQRSNRNKSWTPAWATKLHSQDRLRTTLDADPNVLLDVYACNKIFRKSFWDDHLKAFPEGTRYEDQEVTAKAYTVSNSFDILQKVVYSWHVRNDGTSITQQKGRIEDLSDRLSVAKKVASILNTEQTQKAFRSWLPQTIGFLLAPYYTEAPRAEDSYWEMLQAGVKDLAGMMTQDDWRQVSFWDRLTSLSAVYGTLDDIKLIQSRKQEYKSGYSISRSRGKLIATTDFINELSFDLPEVLLEIDDKSLTAAASILSSDWNDSNELIIRFNAQIPGIDSNKNAGQCRAFLVSSGNGGSSSSKIPLTVSPATEPSFDAFSNDSYNSYSKSVYSTVLAPNELLKVYGQELTDSDWHLEIELEILNITRRITIVRVSPLGSGATVTHGRADANTRLTIQYTNAGNVSFSFRECNILVGKLRIDSEHLLLKVSESTIAPEGKFELRRTNSKIETDTIPLQANNLENTYSLPVPGISTTSLTTVWDIVYRTATDLSEVSYAGSSKDLRACSPYGEPYRLALSDNGNLQLTYSPVGMHIDQVAVSTSGRYITLAGFGTLPPGSNVTMQFVKGSAIISAVVDWRAGTHEFSATIDLEKPGIFGQQIAHKPGGYALTVDIIDINGETMNMWVPVTLQLMSSLPMHHINSLCRIRLARTKGARALWLDIYPRLNDDERGPLAERRLHNRIAEFNGSKELLDATLFESYGGLSVSDSPLELFRYARDHGLGGALYWAIRDASVAVPLGCTALIIGSREYIRVLHTAKTLVNNNNFPHYFRKTPGQHYLQTWHGTPLKRIGNDVPRTSLSQSYRALMDRESQYWDCLLSQNPYASPVLASAFGYSGRILETGYPRNDILAAPMSRQEDEESRANLGIAAQSKIVLYAPTWRDNIRTASNHYDLATFVDFEDLRQEFGNDVRILLRGHSNTSQAARKSLPDNVIDVSDHHDLNELMRLSDLLVTDYSSIMFDYSCTGKPIIIHAPDYEEYSGKIRGFYFDLRENAPGPISYNNEELTVCIYSYLFGQKEAPKYFASAFTPNDDGFATNRVAQDLWKQSLIS